MKSTLEISEIIQLLGLKKLENEGGMYRETYRCSKMIDGNSCGSAIYYLLTANSFSHMHKNKNDEIYHFYLGDPIELLMIDDEGNPHIHILGQDIKNGQNLQLVVPGGYYQGSHLIEGGKFALISTTMSPAFQPEDYILACREELLERCPQVASLIEKLTGDFNYL